MLFMDNVRITEELVILLALKNYLEDLYPILEANITKDETQEIMQEIYQVAYQVYNRKLKDVPQFEREINGNSLTQRTNEP